MVFNYQKYKDAMMDRGFIDDIHKYLGDKIGRRFFIIAPAASVQFLEDYIEKARQDILSSASPIPSLKKSITVALPRLNSLSARWM